MLRILTPVTIIVFLVCVTVASKEVSVENRKDLSKGVSDIVDDMEMDHARSGGRPGVGGRASGRLKPPKPSKSPKPQYPSKPDLPDECMNNRPSATRNGGKCDGASRTTQGLAVFLATLPLVLLYYLLI